MHSFLGKRESFFNEDVTLINLLCSSEWFHIHSHRNITHWAWGLSQNMNDRKLKVVCYCTYEWEMCHRYDHILLYTHMKFVKVIKTKKICRENYAQKPTVWKCSNSSNTQTNLCYISIGLSFQTTVLFGLIKLRLKLNIKRVLSENQESLPFLKCRMQNLVM